MTQCSDAGEARTCNHSVSSQALYHWATALQLIQWRLGCFVASVNAVASGISIDGLLFSYVYMYIDLNVYAFFNKWAATWDFQQCGMCDQQSLRSAVWSEPLQVAWTFYDG